MKQVKQPLQTGISVAQLRANTGEPFGMPCVLVEPKIKKPLTTQSKRKPKRVL